MTCSPGAVVLRKAHAKMRLLKCRLRRLLCRRPELELHNLTQKRKAHLLSGLRAHKEPFGTAMTLVNRHSSDYYFSRGGEFVQIYAAKASLQLGEKLEAQ